jgi:hypothetical protein
MREIQPVVPGGDRIVLLEEFTGKGCTNCPKGSREIESLLALYDSNLVVVSIHAGFFANPNFFDLGQYDLRTDEGEQIFGMLGPNIGYPAGVVNRTKYNGDYQHGAQSWADFIKEELDKEPRIEFTVDHEFNSKNRTITLDVNGFAREDINNEVRISVMVTEDGIVDAQDDLEAGGIVEDYVHKHVLRGMATPFDGQKLADQLGLGQAFNSTITANIHSDWNEGNCSVLVFLSEINGSDDIRVLQASEVHVTE